MENHTVELLLWEAFYAAEVVRKAARMTRAINHEDSEGHAKSLFKLAQKLDPEHGKEGL